ncbi:hypothetical protein [Flindersiella endophytica]
MRRALLLAVIGTAVAALVATWFGLAHRTDEVASIDGHTVTRDELLFHMRRLAPTVQNELRNEYGLRGATDWTTRVGDGTALDRLASAAFDEIWRDKTTLLLAQDHGLAVPADHDDFLAELADENERRAGALAKGEVVYGVGEFSPEEYYSHRLAEITTGLKERLSAGANGPLWVGESDVRRAFDADRAAWSANATTFGYSKLVVRVPDDAAPDYSAGLQQRVAAAGRLATVAAREPGATYTTDTYDGGAAGLSANDQDLRTVLGALDPGEISAPAIGTGQITYYQLDDRTVDEDAAFDAYAQRIRLSLVEKKFQQLVQRRVDDSDIQIDAAAVDAINAEDVQQ